MDSHGRGNSGGRGKAKVGGKLALECLRWPLPQDGILFIWDGASQRCARGVVVPLSTGQNGMADELQDPTAAPAV